MVKLRSVASFIYFALLHYREYAHINNTTRYANPMENANSPPPPCSNHQSLDPSKLIEYDLLLNMLSINHPHEILLACLETLPALEKPPSLAGVCGVLGSKLS
jgi:hypothetical protein